MDLQFWTDLDRELLLFFNGSDSLFLDSIMTTLTSGLTWIPLYLALFYLVIKNNETMQQISLIMLSVVVCIVLADGMADLVMKPLVGRWRPCNDPAFKQMVDVVGNLRGGDYGFFSAHAANTMSLAVFFCLLVRNKTFCWMMVLWSLLNCYTRMYLGLHYPGDILCGLLWGGLVGSVVYFFYQKFYFKMSPRLHYVSTQYSSTGYALLDIDIVINVMMLTLLAALILSIIRLG